MSDLLADRFLAIADLADDGDWGDVRRRAGANARHRRVPLLAAALAAVVVTAVAFAASGGWIFKRAPYAEPSFAKTFSFQGASWSLVGYLDGNGGLTCFSVGRTDALLSARPECRIHLMTPPGFSPFSANEPLRELDWAHGRGEVWFGEARATVARVSITDSRGHTFTAPAVSAPTLPDPTAHYRLWLIALPTSWAVSISAYDRHGKLLYRGSPRRGLEPVYLHR